MEVKQLYTNCLAEAAYYIESEGEAAIIDPLRETDQYIELAKSRGAKIKYVFETHFHADFVSGHIDLGAKTGTPIVFGPGASTGYKSYIAKDGEVFSIGKVTIKVIHTPGHTMESTCYLLSDEKGKPYCIFTGDTLFVGDVGRPDLLDASVKVTPEEMAGSLFDSLQNKIKTLPDDLIVYPAHGPGSACGKNIGKETWSTIGDQKQTNYALGSISKEEFIHILVSDLAAPPAYFFEDARINKNGYDSYESVIRKNAIPLSPGAFEAATREGAFILDTRKAIDFESGFVPGSMNIGLDGMFAVWVGTLVDIRKNLVLVTDPGKEIESITRLSRVGYDKVSGYLSGGIDAWKKEGKPLETIQSINPEELQVEGLNDGKTIVLDVRKESEVKSGKIKGAINIPLEILEKNLGLVDKNKKYLVHCAGGYRSMIASSMLKSNGIKNLKNIYGGYNKIKTTSVETE